MRLRFLPLKCLISVFARAGPPSSMYHKHYCTGRSTVLAGGGARVANDFTIYPKTLDNVV